MSSSDDAEKTGEPLGQLVVLEGALRRKKRKSLRHGQSRDPMLRFQLIDCRPNLFDCLAKASADISLWKRSLVVLRLWFDQISVVHRRSTPHMNDNRP